MSLRELLAINNVLTDRLEHITHMFVELRNKNKELEDKNKALAEEVNFLKQIISARTLSPVPREPIGLDPAVKREFAQFFQLRAVKQEAE
jgi:hypothetical protein